MLRWGCASACLTALFLAGSALADPQVTPAQPATFAAGPAVPIRSLPAGTRVELMVVNEVSTKVARLGDRFVLRVNAAVSVNGQPVVPVGTLGYGEVMRSEGNGALGHAGRLAARLLYLDLGGHHVSLRGDAVEAGQPGTTSNVLGFIALGYAGPLALLAPGNNAKLKAGQLLVGYIDEAVPLS